MITVFMEMWMAFWSWITGKVDPDDPFNVWQILWRDGGEWYARPPGQHREGFSVEKTMEMIKRREQHAACLRSSERYRLASA